MGQRPQPFCYYFGPRFNRRQVLELEHIERLLERKAIGWAEALERVERVKKP